MSCIFKAIAVLPALAAALLSALPAQAQVVTLTVIETVIETVEIGTADAALDYALDDWTLDGEAPLAKNPQAPPLAIFGPFRVTDAFTAEMYGTVGSATPSQFAAMRAAYPELRALRMIECPGSDDDEANLALARMVRAANIDTIVPAGGSVRSGAVELFLAGVHRQADSRAEFAVHSWRDDLGREANDLDDSDPVHREYLDFYRDMGLGDDVARRFYALSNSVPFDKALYLQPAQLAVMGLLSVI